jgi:hypothetical protein
MMKPHQEPGPGLLCIAVLVTIAAMAIAGCLGTTPDPQDTAPAVTGLQAGNNAAGTAVMTATPKAPAVSVTSPSLPAKDPSARFITVDPIGTKNLGDLLVISGTTNLPEKTALSVSRAYGMSGEAGTWANIQVRPGTNGINRWRFVSDSSGLRPGTYNVTVATGKHDVEGSAQFSLAGTFLGTDHPLYYSGAGSNAGSGGTPEISVQPPGDRKAGDVFLIAGTTTLAKGTILLCQVYPDYFEDASKRKASFGAPSGIASDSIVIRDGGSAARWSFALDTEGYETGGYIVNVSTMGEDYSKHDVFGTAHFTVL